MLDKTGPYTSQIQPCLRHFSISGTLVSVNKVAFVDFHITFHSLAETMMKMVQVNLLM